MSPFNFYGRIMADSTFPWREPFSIFSNPRANTQLEIPFKSNTPLSELLEIKNRDNTEKGFHNI